MRFLRVATLLLCLPTLVPLPIASAQFSQQGSKLVGTGAVGSPTQGYSVSLSADGKTAIVGGPADASNVGAAWVFTCTNGVWSQQGAKLVGSGAVGSPSQGYAVSLSADGNTALVGGPADAANVGAAWVFTRTGGAWAQQGTKLVGTGAVGAARQGVSVALSADGNTATVGGSADNSNAGAAWFFTRASGIWSQMGCKLVGTGAGGNARQGFSVTLSSDGNTALVGGPMASSNFGTAWAFSRANGGLTGSIARVFAVADPDLFAGTESGGVFLSTNSGTSWKEINTGLTNLSVIALAANSTNVFAGTYGDGVFLSTNRGTTWTPVVNGLTNKNVQALALSGANLFAGTDDGVFFSANSGGSWTHVNSGMAGKIVRSLLVSGTGLFAGTESGEVYRSPDNGSTWSSLSSGLPGVTVFALNMIGTDLFAGTAYGVYRSTNGGTGWSQVNTDLAGNTNVQALAVIGANIFAATYGGGVFLSTNSGTGWTPMVNGLTGTVVRSLAPAGVNLFAGTDGGVFLSTNSGTNWTRVDNAWIQEGKLSLWPDGYEAQQGYAVALSADGNTAMVGGPYHNQASGGAWAFTRTGVAWASQGTRIFSTGAVNAPSLGFSVSLSADGNTALVGGPSDAALVGSTWVFNRVGGAWSQLGSKLVGTGGVGNQNQGRSVSLSSDGNTALIGAPADASNVGSSWVFARSGTDVPDQAMPLPLQFGLDQNYPNPFNPTTVICYRLPVASDVKLTVFDILGREEMVLVDGQQVPGLHTVWFGGTNLSSGVYIYRMVAGGFVQTRKMALVK